MRVQPCVGLVGLYKEPHIATTAWSEGDRSGDGSRGSSSLRSLENGVELAPSRPLDLHM